MLKSYLSIVASMTVITMLNTGCGSSSNTTTPVVAKTYTGIFVDIATDGISYICGSISGVTSGGGKFTGCAENDLVSFSLGNLSLGSMTRPSNGVFTPKGLAKAKYPNNPTAAKIEANSMAAAILSLDADGDSTNGITITPNNIALFNKSVPAGSSISDPATVITVLAAVATVVSDPANANSGMATKTVAEAESHLAETAANIENGTFNQENPTLPAVTGGSN